MSNTNINRIFKKKKIWKKKLIKKKVQYIWDYKKSFFFNIFLRNKFYVKNYSLRKKVVFKKKRLWRFVQKWFQIKLLRIFIANTPHNFFMSLHRMNGEFLFCTSSGMHGFKGKRKLNYSTAVELGRFLTFQFRRKKKRYFLFIYFSGLNRFRFAILKGLNPRKNFWFFKVKFIFDKCYLPHNGLTLSKKRRKKRRGKKNLYAFRNFVIGLNNSNNTSTFAKSLI